MSSSAVAAVQAGTRSQLNSTPPANAAHAHASGRSAARSAGGAGAAAMSCSVIGSEHRERRETAMPVLGAAVRRQQRPGKRYAVALAVRLGLEHPARQLREARL